MITGLDTMRALAERYPLIFMGHPSLTGAYTHAPGHGVAHGVLLGTLFRLAGADISVFPDAGGRFRYTEAECGDITERLREPLGALRPAWPSPAGGMGPADVGRICEAYGPDTVLLIGGALLGHPDGIEAGTRQILDRIREVHPEVSIEPADPPRLFTAGTTPARLPPGLELGGPRQFPVQGRRRPHLPGVRRVELVGKFGERTRCDLRYFEVEPGGHTSLEKAPPHPRGDRRPRGGCPPARRPAHAAPSSRRGLRWSRWRPTSCATRRRNRSGSSASWTTTATAQCGWSRRQRGPVLR